tara:strand:- start:47 stop:313 length:267 start_codon:yes stop_codon:yes gene_type:complete
MMTHCIKDESLGFLDDPEACAVWQVVSETAFGTEFTNFDTLAEATAWMGRNLDEDHLVQGCDEDGCVITDAYTVDDIVQMPREGECSY